MSTFENAEDAMKTGMAAGRILNAIHNPEIVNHEESATFMAHCISVLDEKGFETLKAMMGGYMHIRKIDPIATLTDFLEQLLITEENLAKAQNIARNESEV